MIDESSAPSNPKSFRWLRLAFFWFRLLLMLTVAGLTAQLVIWNREYDPRFYHFLSTRPGRRLSQVMNWPNLYNRPETDRDLSEFTEEERHWRQRIESRLEEIWPTHTVTLNSGEEIHVRFLEVSEWDVRVRQDFGGQGSLETRIPRSRIESIEPYAVAKPQVTWRDIRFQMEYPDFQLVYVGHYTVLTDAPYYQSRDSIEALETLRVQYMDLFSPLVRFRDQNRDLQVLFFSRETDYRNHHTFQGHGLEESVGYYSPLEDRLVLFNQHFSERNQNMRRDINREIEVLLNQVKRPDDRQKILKLRDSLEDRIRRHAKEETLSTLRHEGVHHLSYTYGVHSWIHAENGWLIEGLATYFETLEPGAPSPSHLMALFKLDREGRMPTLRQLTAVRKPEQFSEDLPGLKPYEAYSVSWSLVVFLMLPENRDAFFDYIRHVQDPPSIRLLMDTPRVELLARYLGRTEEGLERDWRRHLQRMLVAETPESAV